MTPSTSTKTIYPREVRYLEIQGERLLRVRVWFVGSEAKILAFSEDGRSDPLPMGLEESQIHLFIQDARECLGIVEANAGVTEIPEGNLSREKEP